MKLTLFLFAFAAIFIPSASAISIDDGDFSSWALGAAGVGTGYAISDSTSGNPGARLYVFTNATTNAYMMATAIKTDFLLNSPIANEQFSLSLDVLSGSQAFGEGQAVWLLIQQSGGIYADYLGVTGYPHNYDTVTYSGAFTESNFVRLTNSGPTSPDFTGGIPIQVGFGAGNFNSKTDQYYDNFHLNFVPEPSSTLLILTGAALILRRRHYYHSERTL